MSVILYDVVGLASVGFPVTRLVLGLKINPFGNVAILLLLVYLKTYEYGV